MNTGLVCLTVAVAVVSFLLGSIPCGLLLGKFVYGVDPRDTGSKSIGATNVNRAAGWKGGVWTLVLDTAKGALAVGLARLVVALVPDMAPYAHHVYSLALLFAISGHIYSPWLGFKGGKGISTGLGTSLVVHPLIALSLIVVFLVFVLITRRVSVGSIIAAAWLPFSAMVFVGMAPAVWVPIALAAVFVIVAHRGNILRIARGEEPKFSFNKGEKKEGAK